MGKQTICICENKGADRGNREADQRLCFRYSDSTFPPLLNSKISSFYLFSVLVQAGLCRTCSETTLLVFPRGGSYNKPTSGWIHYFHEDLDMTLRKLAHVIYGEFFSVAKIKNFIRKVSIFFLFLLKT